MLVPIFDTFTFVGIEGMKMKLGELQKQITQQEDEKATLQRDIEEKMCRLDEINASLSKKTEIRNEYDRTLAEAEAAYSKVYVCVS
jgi:septal ring factor EnvC (AmiA/AmiB activator)